MKTRRDVIAGGIASLLMPNISIASPIKSMLGAERHILTDQESTFDNPYVSDGLVAMWDGELSNGELVDLISGISGKLPSEVSYSETDKAFVFSENAQMDYILSPESQSAVMSANCTYEFCCSILPYTYVAYRTLFSTPDFQIYNYTPRGVSTTQNYIFLNYYGRTSRALRVLNAEGNFSGTVQLVCNSTSMTSLECAYGVQFGKTSFSTIPTSTISSFRSLLMPNAKVFSFRIYNRPLSLQEISYNYSIDRERFNLP
jgi:hypothetical protein